MELLKDQLRLTEDEALALLGLCMTSPGPVDAVAVQAMRKLAEYCSQRRDEVQIQSDLPQAASWQSAS